MRFDELMLNRKTVNCIINMKDRSEQERFLEEYTDYLYKNDIRLFRGLDRFLCLKLNGSLSDVQNVFGCIDSSSVYSNYYEGVLSIDVTELIYPRNELSAQYFCEHISDPKYADHATIILFVDDLSSEEAKRFGNRLDGYLKVKKIDYSSIK